MFEFTNVMQLLQFECFIFFIEKCTFDKSGYLSVVDSYVDDILLSYNIIISIKLRECYIIYIFLNPFYNFMLGIKKRVAEYKLG